MKRYSEFMQQALEENPTENNEIITNSHLSQRGHALNLGQLKIYIASFVIGSATFKFTVLHKVVFICLP